MKIIIISDIFKNSIQIHVYLDQFIICYIHHSPVLNILLDTIFVESFYVMLLVALHLVPIYAYFIYIVTE